MRNLELWAGAECTVSRVGNVFRDQLKLTGHHDREDDLHLLADLGIAALRMPLLWERIAPEKGAAPDWEWSDRRLGQLREMAIRPIAGLIHHGSGPAYTSLLEAGFGSGLAAHALACAERYPWIEDWTPVNEPLTTARFSTLYGHWYPHLRDERSFWTALLNQIDAVRLSMQAIRSVIPGARLIQTEDLGRTYSTVALADQAGFDNARRWLTWDLLCGRVSRQHDLWDRLCGFGFERRLLSFLEESCPPDVIGINHYLTSDRFLDHRLQRYPPETHGGNGVQSYADVAAVRVVEPSAAGLSGAICEAWERYGLPLALTEVHNGCTREEQVRWMDESWETANRLRKSGVEICAFTAWALFGSQGWNTLLTGHGRYESGLFDVTSGKPRETALAKYAKSLQNGGARSFAKDTGWWRRDKRFEHAAARRAAAMSERPRSAPEPRRPPLLILGSTGTLGRALAAECRHRNLAHVLVGRREVELPGRESIAAVLDRHCPWAVINAAGWVRVDEAETNETTCIEANAIGATALAHACQSRNIPTVSFSSDLVFGDDSREFYRESDEPAPRNVYGASKRRMEREILDLDGSHLIIRTAGFFSPFDFFNFPIQLVHALRRGERFLAADDSVVTPTYVPDLCARTLDLLLDGEKDIWHLTNEEALSWAAFGRRIARASGLDPTMVEPVGTEQLGWNAARPASSALKSEKGSAMPPLAAAIERFGQLVQRRM